MFGLVEALDMAALFIFMTAIATTIELTEVAQALKSPKVIFLCLLGQHILLPPISYVMTIVLGLNPEIAFGLTAICVCPGGTTSNLLCQMFQADIPVSITMTTVSSFVALGFLPLNLYLYSPERIDHGFWSMIKFIFFIGSGTIAGLALERFVGGRVTKMIRLIGSFCPLYLIGYAVVQNSTSGTPFWVLPGRYFLAALFPFVFGHTFGLIAGIAVRLKKPTTVSLAVETSTQNKLIAIGLIDVIKKSHGGPTKAIPLLYGFFAIVLNLTLLTVYWQLGWTSLDRNVPWYTPLKGLALQKIKTLPKRRGDARVAAMVQENNSEGEKKQQVWVSKETGNSERMKETENGVRNKEVETCSEKEKG